MIETLLGGLLGGAFRLAPEILKWLDRNGERAHELAMQDKALEFEKLRGAQRMAEILAQTPDVNVVYTVNEPAALGALDGDDRGAAADFDADGLHGRSLLGGGRR